MRRRDDWEDAEHGLEDKVEITVNKKENLKKKRSSVNIWSDQGRDMDGKMKKKKNGAEIEWKNTREEG